MKIVLCVNCGHHKKEHASLGCSPSSGMSDFIGVKYTIETISYSCECREFIENNGMIIEMWDVAQSKIYYGIEIYEQFYCEELERAGLL